MAKVNRKARIALLLALVVFAWMGEYHRWSRMQTPLGVKERRLKGVEAGHHHPLVPAGLETTDQLTAKQLQKREFLFGSIIVSLLLVLLIGSIIAVVCKSRRCQLFGSVLYDCDNSSSRALLVETEPLLTPHGEAQDTSVSRIEGRKAIAEDMRSLNAKTASRSSTAMQSLRTKEKDDAWEKLTRKESDIRASHEYSANKWRNIRFYTMIVLLFLYIATCLVLPRWHKETASCHKGFFWEMHMIFFSVFCLTKISELILYTFDPTIEGDLDWIEFSTKFLPSFVSYSDGYLDSTSIQIAAECSEEAPVAHYLSWSMLLSYSVGVVGVQWVILLVRTCRDPSQKSLAKLIHMDALASCIKMADGQEGTWWWVCMTRTFGEDIPQALQQIVFVVLVQRNYLMYISITMSLLNGAKGVWDRIPAVVVHGGVYARLMRLIGSEEEVVENDPPRIREFLAKYPFLKRSSHDLYPWLGQAREAFKGDDTTRGEDILKRMEMELNQEGSKLEAAFRMFARTQQDVMIEEEIKKMLEYLGFPAADADVSDILTLVDARDRQLTLAEFEAYVGRTGGIFKLFEIRRQELLKVRMDGDDSADKELRKMELLEVGFEEKELESWKRILPNSEFENVSRLNSAQKQALRHIRQLARQNHLDALPDLKKRISNMGESEDKLWMTLAFIREIAPAIVHVNLDLIAEYLVSDTHYRNQFETSQSGGCLNTRLRQQWERNLFGTAYDTSKGFDRVKYGVLNVLNDKGGVLPCQQYGDSYFVLRDVRLRITCGPEDSSLLKAERLAVLDYYAHVLNEYTDEELQETMTAATSDVEVRGNSKKIEEYKEVQIHGEVALAKHVKAIVVNAKHKDTDVQKKIEAACKKHSFDMVWMDEEEERAIATTSKSKYEVWNATEIQKSDDP